MKREWMWWVGAGAAVGLIVPLTLLSEIGRLLSSALGIPRAALMDAVWPSSFWLLATSGAENTPAAYRIIAVSVVANVVLYTVGAAALWAVKRLVTRMVKVSPLPHSRG
jgi:hypothetical protein